ncbi:preprotein translocase subunit Sec61beta [archaeon]|jgi:preprotein translocase subunit Sec61beta|nr:preprotein translocase subunit Sec61beta [archaeon]MBT6761711.1 preprotein translocase subunit Sec61beta [archaeon]
MAKDNKIHMPSGQGGLTRYFDETSTKLQMSAHTVMILCGVVIVLVIALNFLLNGWLGQ